MPLAAVSEVPLWTLILLAVASPVVAGIAVFMNSKQQGKTLEQQRAQQTATLEQQRDQQAEMLLYERRRDDLAEV